MLLRTRKATSPPAGGGTLALLCNSGPCASAISRWIWDGAQLLGETRAPGQDGLSAGQLDLLVGSAPHYGIVGYMHIGGWDEPRALMNGRVFNPNWRGLPESSVLFDGTQPDCSFGLGGSCITVAWPTDVGTYFRRAVPPTTSPPTPTWLGSLAANGATGSGRLHRRFREFDPATGQFTQEDPIGLAGGANLYGFANGDPVNFGDPFGLQPCPPCALPVGPITGAAGAAAATSAAAAAAANTEALASAIDKGIEKLRDKIQIKLVTYTRTDPTTGRVYTGRTSGFGDPQSIVNARAAGHPARLRGFGPPVVDRWAGGVQGYAAIRGREQLLIDAHGGAQSEGGTSANIIRAVSKNNPFAGVYLQTALSWFGPVR